MVRAWNASCTFLDGRKRRKVTPLACRTTASTALLTSGARRFNPAINLLLQNLQRHAAGLQHACVKLANVEARAERLLRSGAQLANLHLTDFVCEGLTRDGHVAFDFRHDARFWL